MPAFPVYMFIFYDVFMTSFLSQILSRKTGIQSICTFLKASCLNFPNVNGNFKYIELDCRKKGKKVGKFTTTKKNM